jgi:DNA processing protein
VGTVVYAYGYEGALVYGIFMPETYGYIMVGPEAIDKVQRPGHELRLKDLEKPPEELFVLGAEIDQILQNETIAIVGSRKVNGQSLESAYNYGKKCAESNSVVISGLALGIDTSAFEGALSSDGICIAVLPSSVDEVVPKQNQKLAEEILKKGGCLVSEYPSGKTPQKWMFVERNRIIAALSDLVVIGAARENGGAWKTIHTAWELKRPTFQLDDQGILTQLVNPQRRLFDE